MLNFGKLNRQTITQRIMLKIIVLLTHIFYLSYSLSDLYNLVLHSQTRGAACLDGSPAGMYIHEGNGINKKKYMIYFEGGGLCGGYSQNSILASCYGRSLTFLGTTKYYSKTKSFNGKGLLSPLKEENPVFYDWTKVYVIYCDGAAHAGYKEEPVPFMRTKLYFRGSRNTIEHFLYMDKNYDFYNGDTIVITGVSAGGMGAYMWANYLADNTEKAQVLAIPDSGIFINELNLDTNYGYSLYNLIGTLSEMPDPIQQCVRKSKRSLSSCYNVQNYFQYIKPPMFVIQSLYDAYALKNIVGVKCLENFFYPDSMLNCNSSSKRSIQRYHQATIKFTKQMEDSRTDIGIWAPACIQHGFSDTSAWLSNNYKVKGYKLAEAVQKFIDDPMHPLWLEDQQAWPSNTGCNGLRSIRFFK